MTRGNGRGECGRASRGVDPRASRERRGAWRWRWGLVGLVALGAGCARPHSGPVQIVHDAGPPELTRVWGIGDVPDERTGPFLLHFTDEQWQHAIEGIETSERIDADAILLEAVPFPGLLGQWLARPRCEPPCIEYTSSGGRVGCKCELSPPKKCRLRLIRRDHEVVMTCEPVTISCRDCRLVRKWDGGRWLIACECR
jgi:hypothetical protein